MNIYSPSQLTPEESEEFRKSQNEPNEIEVSNETLIQYASKFIEIYRKTLEAFAPQITPYLSTYKGYPYKTNIIRMGKNGVFIFYQDDGDSSVKVTKFEDIDPPVEANLFDIKKGLILAGGNLILHIANIVRPKQRYAADRAH